MTSDGEVRVKEYVYVDEATGKKSSIKRIWTNTSRRTEKVERLNKFLEDNKEWIANEKPSSKKIFDKYNEGMDDELKMSRSMIYTHYAKFCDSNNLPRQRRTRKPKEAEKTERPSGAEDLRSETEAETEKLIEVKIQMDNSENSNSEN